MKKAAVIVKYISTTKQKLLILCWNNRKEAIQVRTQPLNAPTCEDAHSFARCEPDLGMPLATYTDCKQPPREVFSQAQQPKHMEVTVVMIEERQDTSQVGSRTWQYGPHGFADTKNPSLRGYGEGGSNRFQKVV